jgi:hypothetical protein
MLQTIFQTFFQNGGTRKMELTKEAKEKTTKQRRPEKK